MIMIRVQEKVIIMVFVFTQAILRRQLPLIARGTSFTRLAMILQEVGSGLQWVLTEDINLLRPDRQAQIVSVEALLASKMLRFRIVTLKDLKQELTLGLMAGQ